MHSATTLAILAEQAAPAARDGTHPALRFLLENPFAVGLVFIFLVAIVGAFIAARKRDRCLKKFRGFPVTLSEQSICRFTDRLGVADRARRRRQARRLAHPPLSSRAGRWARNVVNTFRDALVKALGMTVQQAARASPSPALAAQSGQINAIGTLLIGETANAYEPMIEQYISRPVILEVTNPADPNARKVEYHGALGEYSAQFVMLVDVRRRMAEHVPMNGTVHRLLEETVEVRAGPEAVHVTNRSGVPVTVEGVTAGGVCHAVNRTVAAGATAETAVPEGARAIPPAPPEGKAADAAPTETPTVTLAWERTFDLIVPRAIGVIRHASDAAAAVSY